MNSEAGSRTNVPSVDVQLPLPILTHPRSSLSNYHPSLPVTDELTAIRSLGRRDGSRQNGLPKYEDLHLDDFEVYYSKEKPFRLCSLHLLGAGKTNHDKMYFDGYLRRGDKRCYVEHVAFTKLPVGNYGKGCDTVGDAIWIRSELNKDRELYYRLGKPSPVYARFYKPYLWVVDLGKHFVDFCEDRLQNQQDVGLADFQQNFVVWLRETYGASTAVGEWHRQYGQDDFRAAVVANGNYLWKEMTDVVGKRRTETLAWYRETSMLQHESWSPFAPDSDRPGIPKTVVTPYNYELFSHLVMGNFLKKVCQKDMPDHWDASGVLPQGPVPFHTGPESGDQAKLAPGRIRVGDVISTPKDVKGSTGNTGGHRYGLVHRSSTCKKSGRRIFDVAWLYSPQDTPCGQMKYPWPKELFLSNRCTCSESVKKAIAENKVTGVHSVAWFGTPDTTAEFFVRQTYFPQDNHWEQLRPAHVSSCKACREGIRKSELGRSMANIDVGPGSQRNYRVGETVLAVLEEEDKTALPFAIEEILPAEGPGKKRHYKLRKLLKRHEADPTALEAPVNELVYTRRFVFLSPRHIIGRCVVRRFPADEAIPSPYNCHGGGNLFFLTHKQVSAVVHGRRRYAVQPLAADEALAMRQGFDPCRPVPENKKLRTLDLFCGCGSLGRGLEDARVVETRWANDIWDTAVHTYMANVDTAGGRVVQPFVGSADILLTRALAGKYSAEVPRPGDVDLIAGGSPCQGFSLKTADKNTPTQYKNRSMIASFASMVELYRPKYGILENVTELLLGRAKQEKRHEEDIFGQLVCALVGLGYQLRVMLGNAWAYGAPQRRQRVFLLFAAPGVALPAEPLPSHGASSGPPAHSRRAIGWLANGEQVARAWEGPTAFASVSIGEATRDLQRQDDAAIGDGLVDICVRHPDHRVVIGLTDSLLVKMAYISKVPYGMNLTKTMTQKGDTHQARVLRLFRSELRKAVQASTFQRVDPTGLLATVTTSCNPYDVRSGAVLHWRDDRPLTLLEARRAQGIPDGEVLLGTPAEQWKMVGNAVARQVSLALGLAVRAS